MSDTRYNQIADALLAKREGLTVPLRLPVEQVLAVEHGVARGTIRRALDHLQNVGAVTRNRKKGTYLTPVHAGLASLKGNGIALVPPLWDDQAGTWINAEVFEGLSRWCDRNNCPLRILHHNTQPASADAWLKRLCDRDVGGVLWLHPKNAMLPVIRQAARYLPTVVLGRHFPGEDFTCVMPDYGQAARLIDEMLCAKGHSQYTVVLMDVLQAYCANWIEAVSTAQRQRGAEFDMSSHILDIRGFDRTRIGGLILDYYQPARPEIQAYVLITSSYLTPLIGNGEFRRRIETGALSVVTMDFGIRPMDSYWQGHTITHVAANWQQVGRKAIETLALLAGGHDAPKCTLMSVSLEPGTTVHACHKGT